MKFTVITHVNHIQEKRKFYAYAPYVREMNLWFKYVEEVAIVASLKESVPSKIDLAYQHENIRFKAIPPIEFTSIKTILFSLLKLPIIIIAIFKACKRADHIHLRCPGNIGLLGCIVQIFFPKKPKTAKYAGNWNPKSKQPISYKLQKWILSNTFLTKNIQVLVYGEWQNQSKNIKPFFTATFNNSEKEKHKKRSYTDQLQFVFVGSLVKGKQPLLAIKIVEALNKKGLNGKLDIFGDGILKQELKSYIENNGLSNMITLNGNQEIEIVKNTLNEAHFLILPSKSEGWPKAVAEAMFCGVIPIATKVSCVPYMLDYGARGILIDDALDEAVHQITSHLKNCNKLHEMSKLSLEWSQKYTLNAFESEISKILEV